MMKEAETNNCVLLLTGDDVAKRLNISIRKVKLMEAEGLLPPSVKVGKKSVRWREADIKRFVESL